MYDKKKFLQGLNAVLDSIPQNVSPEGKVKKEKIKVDLKKIEDKNKSNQSDKDKNQEAPKEEDLGLGQD